MLDRPPSRAEHEDLKERVRCVEDDSKERDKRIETKVDRITWLIVTTLAATLVDIVTKFSH